MAEELTQEEVFANDVDPLDAIRELRKEEGKEPDPELQSSIEDNTTSESVPEPKEEDNDLDAFDDSTDTQDDAAKATGTVDLPSDADEQAAEEKTDELQQAEEGSEESTGTEAGKEEVAEKLTFKANGQDFEFTPDEVVEQFETVFGQAMDYTKKMQQIAPYRKMISALETEGVTQDQLNMAIDALKGDKGAIETLLKAHDIDAYDLGKDEEGASPYTPTSYGKDETTMAIQEIADKISGDPEYKITVDVVDNQWDSKSRETFSSNPEMIQGLHNDIKSGVYDKVAPAAMKMKVLDGNRKSDVEYYVLAGQQMQQAQQGQQSQNTVDQLNQQTQDAVQNADQASSEAQKKRSASSTRTRADRKTVVDYLDGDDETYDAWYKNLMASN